MRVLLANTRFEQHVFASLRTPCTQLLGRADAQYNQNLCGIVPDRRKPRPASREPDRCPRDWRSRVPSQETQLAGRRRVQRRAGAPHHTMPRHTQQPRGFANDPEQDDQEGHRIASRGVRPSAFPNGDRPHPFPPPLGEHIRGDGRGPVRRGMSGRCGCGLRTAKQITNFRMSKTRNFHRSYRSSPVSSTIQTFARSRWTSSAPSST